MAALFFLWKKHLDKHISIIYCEFDWICGIKISNGVNRDYYIFNVYLPYECEEHRDVFNDYLAKLNVVVLNINSTYITILSDFNSNIARRSLFGDIRLNFCVDNDLIMVDKNNLPTDSFTYISPAWGSTSWIDHIVCTSDASLCISNI